MQKGCM